MRVDGVKMSEEREVGLVKEALKKNFEKETGILEKQIRYQFEDTAEFAKALPLQVDFGKIKEYIDKRKEKAEEEYKAALPNLKKISEVDRVKIMQQMLWSQNWIKQVMTSGGPYYFADMPIDDFQAAWHFGTSTGQADANY
ncbi:MAG: hypothetical protein QG670_631 [Thermoproteota archaeon]|nr:hypothetical protein [Thermoproteota archaeon]